LVDSPKQFFTHDESKHFKLPRQLNYCFGFKLVVCVKLFWTVNPPQLNS